MLTPAKPLASEGPARSGPSRRAACADSERRYDSRWGHGVRGLETASEHKLLSSSNKSQHPLAIARGSVTAFLLGFLRLTIDTALSFLTLHLRRRYFAAAASHRRSSPRRQARPLSTSPFQPPQSSPHCPLTSAARENRRARPIRMRTHVRLHATRRCRPPHRQQLMFWVDIRRPPVPSC